MKYVIADRNSLYVFGSYDTDQQARRALRNARTRQHRIRGRKFSLRALADAVVMDSETFQQLDVLVETKNLLSGKTVMIRKSQKGTCVDPGTETYWSM